MNGPKYPLQIVHNGDCHTCLGESKMFATEPEGVRAMSDRNGDSCPKLYECARIQMTPMIRALLRCSASEAMKSICASCDERPIAQEDPKRKKVLVHKRG
jgi:hypothetical protein